jgi:hypothetical protein
VQFEPLHIEILRLQREQADGFGVYSPEYGCALKEAGPAFTGMIEGQPIICAGIARQWNGRGLAWALMSEDCGKHFVAITRAVKRYLDAADWSRLEAQVDAEFPRAIRWAEMLGFSVESLMPRFTDRGRDAFMYVRFGKWLKSQ